ncbi:MAG TPA: hypothetical protein VM580_22075 [Labilithrix sp.]|nr:hypothetical protein [Labilithrix sp.]
MKDFVRIGKHSVGFDPETGFIHICHVGTMNGPEMVELADRIAYYVNTFHPGEARFELVDNRKSTGFTREAREALRNHPMGREDNFLALWGASIGVRTVINLMFKALSLVNASKTVATAKATEAEAREWLTEQRNAYRSRRAKVAES